MMRSFRTRSMTKYEKYHSDVFSDHDLGEQQSIDGSSSTSSFDRFCADILGDGTLTDSLHEAYWDGDASTTSTSVESSPIGWPRVSKEKSRMGKLHSLPKIINSNRDVSSWEDKENKPEGVSDVSEIDMMKERFAKLLLGEDLSGGGKGVSSALAISNAITNLSASVFGELWRLEPLSAERKARWRMEMSWLLSVCDHIVEFVPSSQALPDGNITEVMVTKPRADLHMNLPALKKLDAMLIEALDSFSDTEFWYIDRTRTMTEKDGNLLQRQDNKWWLPTPKIPADGLSDGARRHLQHQRESISQILKAALAINSQVLSEVEIPSVYWDALPKNGRSSLGDPLYRTIASEKFSPEAMIASLDAAHEHNVLQLVNRVEAAIHIWRRKLQARQPQPYARDGKNSMKTSWNIAKDVAIDLEKREQLAEKAESLLLLLRNKFPGLPQTILDVNKIQYNKDVGQSILESYSRILESLAFNILSRIDDVLYADDLCKKKSQGSLPRNSSVHTACTGMNHECHHHGKMSVHSSLSKSASIHNIGSGSPPRSLHSKSLSEYMGWNHPKGGESTKQGVVQHCAGSQRQWSYSGNVNTLRSPPSRD